jgi:uncharacterized protein
LEWEEAMINLRKPLRDRIFALAAFATAALPGASAWAVDDHKLALYITDKDPAKMDLVLNNAANVSRYFSGLGEDVDIVIVGFGPGVSIFLSDRSPVLARLKGFEKSLPNVHFEACNSSIETIEKREKKRPPLMEDVKTVPSGVSELVNLSEKGYAVVKP